MRFGYAGPATQQGPSVGRPGASLTWCARLTEHVSVSDTPMVHASARIATDRPQRYVKQLVSHLGHKLTTSLAEDGVATITFPNGDCLLSPQAGYIDARATGVDEQTLAVVEDVVARHLVRFGSEGELTVTWTPSAGAGSEQPAS